MPARLVSASECIRRIRIQRTRMRTPIRTPAIHISTPIAMATRRMCIQASDITAVTMVIRTARIAAIIGAMAIAPLMRTAAGDMAIAEVTVFAAAITTVADTTGAAGITAVVADTAAAVIVVDSAEDPAAAIAVVSAAAAEDSADTAAAIGDTISGTCLK